jgi:hypothetical protein
MQKEKDKPANKIDRGNITAVIWRNRGRNNGFFYTIEIVRSYETADGKKEDTKTFSVNDLLMVQKVADLAFDWVYEQRAAERAAKRAPERDAESDRDSDDDSEE